MISPDKPIQDPSENVGTNERPAPANPVPGPVDPENFYDAQRRNRHATWRISALCFAAALVMGLPLTLVLTPLFYAVTLIGAEIFNAFSPLPPEFWRQAHALAGLMVSVMNWALNHKPIDLQALLFGLALLLLPGVVISLFLWLAVRTMLRRGGVGGSLISLQARQPNPGDLKELQLANAAQEMAIAAGLPAPRLQLMNCRDRNQTIQSPSVSRVQSAAPAMDSCGAQCKERPSGKNAWDMLPSSFMTRSGFCH